jgi:Trypsin-co-occurring domain 1
MSDVQKLILKDGDDEYEVYIASKETFEVPEAEPGYRDIELPTVDMEQVHHTIRGYAQYAIGAFKNFAAAEVEKMTLKFNLKIAGKTGIPMLTEGSAEGNLEIQVECKFANIKKG